jgi:hypothetical protein
MPHRFVIMISGRLHEFDRYEDIPDAFDHVIEFCPEIPAGPHTRAQHEEIAAWVPRFERLMEIEHARSRKTR